STADRVLLNSRHGPYSSASSHGNGSRSAFPGNGLSGCDARHDGSVRHEQALDVVTATRHCDRAHRASQSAAERASRTHALTLKKEATKLAGFHGYAAPRGLELWCVGDSCPPAIPGVVSSA